MILLRMFLSSLLFFLNPVPSQRDQILNEDQFEPGQWNTYICFELLIVKITVDETLAYQIICSFLFLILFTC